MFDRPFHNPLGPVKFQNNWLVLYRWQDIQVFTRLRRDFIFAIKIQIQEPEDESPLSLLVQLQI